MILSERRCKSRRENFGKNRPEALILRARRITRDLSSRVPAWQDVRCRPIRLCPSSETSEAFGGIADSPKAEVINNLLGMWQPTGGSK